MTQTQLANATGKAVAYTNQTITGRRTPSAEWVDLVANAMNATDEERARLHYSAALDNGFKLDLTIPKKR